MRSPLHRTSFIWPTSDLLRTASPNFALIIGRQGDLRIKPWLHRKSGGLPKTIYKVQEWRDTSALVRMDLNETLTTAASLAAVFSLGIQAGQVINATRHARCAQREAALKKNFPPLVTQL